MRKEVRKNNKVLLKTIKTIRTIRGKHGCIGHKISFEETLSNPSLHKNPEGMHQWNMPDA
jgi:hypothetical protein